jgi:hypothetical protein
MIVQDADKSGGGSDFSRDEPDGICNKDPRLRFQPPSASRI